MSLMQHCSWWTILQLDTCMCRNESAGVKSAIPYRQRRKEARSPFIGRNKKCSSKGDPLSNSTKNKFWACISVNMRVLGSFNSKTVLSSLQYIPSTNMHGIIISKQIFYLCKKHKKFAARCYNFFLNRSINVKYTKLNDLMMHHQLRSIYRN